MEILLWDQELSHGISRIPDFRIRITDGTFSELVEVTSNRQRSVVYTEHAGASWVLNQVGSDAIPPGDETTRLKDVWGRIPALHDAYAMTFQETPPSIPVVLIAHTGRGASVICLPTTQGLPQEAFLRASLQLHDEVNLRPEDHHYLIGDVPNVYFYLPHNPLDRENDPFDHASELPPVKNDARGISFLVAPFMHGLRLSTLSLLYLTAYSHGMLVRYNPSAWSKLVGRVTGDRVLPLVRAATSVIEAAVPALVLEQIES